MSSEFSGRWDRIFLEAHLHSWPTASLCISNLNPNPNAEGSRNIFKEDREEIESAAAKHGYICIHLGEIVHYLK
jgi:hypothetical protein